MQILACSGERDGTGREVAHVSSSNLANRLESSQNRPIGMKQLPFRLVVVFVMLSRSAVSQAQDTAPRFEGDRIIIDAKVNQRPASFVFDTGASFSAIFASSSKRLEVELDSTGETTIAGHTVKVGTSKPLAFSMLGKVARIPAKVLLTQRRPGLNGVFGWRDLAVPLVLIDGVERRLTIPREVPESGWQRWQIEKENSQLFFAVTKDGRPFGRVFVDLGSSTGLRLSPTLWKQWRESNPSAPTTLEALRYFVGKPTVHEVSWTQEYQLGDLILRNVDIGTIPEALEGTAVDVRGQEFIATLGIRTLRHLRLIVSRESGELLTQSVPLVPQHNRAGAIFMESTESIPLFVAHVLRSSPADEAGLKGGDHLEKIDGVDFGAARKDTATNPTSLFYQPAGTKLRVKVIRADESREITIVLRDLLP